jgi:hypothetical protein
VSLDAPLRPAEDNPMLDSPADDVSLAPDEQT